MKPFLWYKVLKERVKVTENHLQVQCSGLISDMYPETFCFDRSHMAEQANPGRLFL